MVKMTCFGLNRMISKGFSDMNSEEMSPHFSCDLINQPRKYNLFRFRRKIPIPSCPLNLNTLKFILQQYMIY
uniref:Uncharacterized protein n=1 Tax=Lepeophtheirus salmonis TaxID=72036 RepID=A0A0K2TQK0_LEPSM